MFQIFKKIARLFSYDIGIDLGTANTLVYIKDQGIVLREPSVVAMKGDKVKAVGEEAKRMVGRTPGSVVAIRPLKEGVIADFEVAHNMLRYFIKRACQRRSIRGPRILIAHPSGITEVERHAIEESAYDMGADSFRVFMTVTLPLIKDSFLSGLVTAFVRSITAISAIILLVTPQFLLITVQINEFAEKGSYGIACAFATILIAITYGSVLLMNLFIKYFGTSRKLKEVD